MFMNGNSKMIFLPLQVKNENNETPLNLSEVDDVSLKFLEEFKTKQ